MAKNETPPFQIVPRSEIEGELSDGAFRTLQMIRQHCIANEFCWLSTSKMAEIRTTSARTIMRHLSELVKKRYISRERRDGTTSICKPKDLYRTRATGVIGVEEMTEPAPSVSLPMTNLSQTHATGVIPPTPLVAEHNSLRNKKEETRKKKPPAHAREATPDETANRIFKLFESVIATPPLRGSAVDDYEAIEYHLSNLIKKHGFDAIFQKSNEVLTRRGTRIRDIRYLMTADGKGGALANVEWESESEGEERHREIMEMAARMRGSKKRKARSEL